jgi:hypothetical protein
VTQDAHEVAALKDAGMGCRRMARGSLPKLVARRTRFSATHTPAPGKQSSAVNLPCPLCRVWQGQGPVPRPSSSGGASSEHAPSRAVSQRAVPPASVHPAPAEAK